MFTFRSYQAELILHLPAQLVETVRDGQVISQFSHTGMIHFINHSFTTTEEMVAKFLRENKRNGKLYYEIPQEELDRIQQKATSEPVIHLEPASKSRNDAIVFLVEHMGAKPEDFKGKKAGEIKKIAKETYFVEFPNW
jgi:hypothetical protein